MGESDQQAVPRWAEELGEKTWAEISELLDGGFRTMDIVRELSIPEGKVRSLQLYVQRHGPRRRLQQFARFKDALLSQIGEFGEEMVKALSVTAALAVSNDTKPGVQVRAIEAMNNFTNVLNRMMADDTKAEQERRRHERTGDIKLDPVEAFRAVLAEYGVADDGEQRDG